VKYENLREVWAAFPQRNVLWRADDQTRITKNRNNAGNMAKGSTTASKRVPDWLFIIGIITL
jgi:hypothetical protein